MNFREYLQESLKQAIQLTRHMVRDKNPAPKKTIGQRITHKIISMFGGKPKQTPIKLRSTILNNYVGEKVNKDKRMKAHWKNIKDVAAAHREKVAAKQAAYKQSRANEKKKMELSDKAIAKKKIAVSKVPKNTKKEVKVRIMANLKGIRDAVKRWDDKKLQDVHNKIKNRKKPSALGYSTSLEMKARKKKASQKVSQFNQGLRRES